ncbi:putative aldouronate transport system permease protein [Anaerocolumna jejuensis DSM 15929]|uniref:Putative aldouronate transport system permease protein n=1 Tax=Anaerocolumna jejuensis DSM 15929 TaxID=1121322 RepID=A0A1M6Z7Q7_9FIRM|nr:ABC transporter permease subunit [Anaerocolumna jejuensis]SHL26359.1 putative aldouronate transport system permease protein [Anaerocolumna jejuensis DSM 15929]
MARTKTETGHILRKMKRYIPLYLMMFPGLLYFFINNYIPMAGITIAFRNYNVKKGLFGSDFIGLRNFGFLFKSDDLWKITKNTMCYNISFILLDLLLGVFFAICICEIRNKKARKVYQSAILLPYVMSIVIVAYMVYGFFNSDYGFINNTVLEGLKLQPVTWYSEPKYWPFILTFVHCWIGVGYGCMIYIASILGMDEAMFEAAKIDGATKLQQIRLLIIPLLKGTMITMVLLSVGKIFYSDFGLFYQVPQNSGTLYSVTDTIDTYVYRSLLQIGNIGMSAAAGFYQSILGFIFVVTANLIVRKIDKDSALF